MTVNQFNLLQELKEQTDNPILQRLLSAYLEILGESEDKKASGIFDQIKVEFEEYKNADKNS